MLAYIYFLFFMFTFPTKGDTLDFFSLSGLIFSLWCACVVLVSPWQSIHQRGSALQHPIYSELGWKKDEQTNVSKHVTPSFLFWRIHKKRREKNAKMLWMYDWTCHLQDCTFLTVLFTKGILNALNKRREICCIVYKVMFIQYFNITSDFRGRYLNRILYLYM